MCPLLWLILLSILAKITFTQTQVRSLNQFQNCNDAPTAALRETCLNLQNLAAKSRQAFEQQSRIPVHPPGVPEHLKPGPISPGSRGQFARHPYDCMTVTCLCPYFQGTISPQNQCLLQNGQILTMAYRKEYRMLTEDERLRYQSAVIALKERGEYDRISLEHQSVGTGSGAHSGPAFLPWHREYIKRFEIALRLIDPSVAIPYWDSVMDNYLPDPRDSIFFSPIFMGETDVFGNVITGPFAFWSTLDGRNAIIRNLGAEGALFSEASIGQVMQQNAIENVLAYTAPLMGCPYPVNFGALEYSHSNVHLWVGGHMKPPQQAANDPIFFSHHSFVDFIWELWRQNAQSRWAREMAYPPDIAQCADPQHFSYAPMRPYFNLMNRDGLSNMYTDQMYRFAPRPGCTAEMRTCGSPYLFCDTRGNPHCVSKIKPNGLCIGFEGLDACFNSVCVMGRCVPGPTPPPFVPQTHLTQTQQIQIQRAHTRRQFVDCFNRNPCCEFWAHEGECRRNGIYMQQYCRAACHVCTPSYNATDECSNRHIACGQWSSEGQCHGDSDQFMQENCRQSCNLCNTLKNISCRRPSEIHAHSQSRASTFPTRTTMKLQHATATNVVQRKS